MVPRWFLSDAPSGSQSNNPNSPPSSQSCFQANHLGNKGKPSTIWRYGGCCRKMQATQVHQSKSGNRLPCSSTCNPPKKSRLPTSYSKYPMSTTTKGGIIYPLENQVFPNIASRYWSLGYDRTKRCPREPRGSHLGWLLMSSKEMEAIWANKRSACRAKRASGCLKLGMKGRPHFFRGSPL